MSFTPIQPPQDPKECPTWLYETLKRLNRAGDTSAQGLAAIVRGEAPDGSGSPLIGDLTSYFYKPGRLGGQTAYGGTVAGDALRLLSTAHSTKGKIYLGASSAFDESTTKLGINTTSPAARLHSVSSSGSTTTKYAPTGATTTSGWSGAYTDVDEEPASDSDFMSKTNLVVGPKFSFAAITTPSSTATVVVKVRMRWQGTNAGSVGVQYTIRIYDTGGTERATAGPTVWAGPGAATDTGWVEKTLTLSAAEVAAFNSWSAVTVQVEQGGGGTGFAMTSVAYSYVSIQVTDITDDPHFRATTEGVVVTNMTVDGNIGMGITTTTPSAMIHLASRAATTVPLLIVSNASQTANLLSITSSVSGNATFNVDSKAFLTASLKSSGFFVDSTDLTKKLALNLSGISTATTRTLLLLNFNSTVPVVGNSAPAISAGSLAKVDATGQSASIASTNLTNSAAAGWYDVEVYAVCTTLEAGVTLDVTIGWTDVLGATTAAPFATFSLAATGRTSGVVRCQLSSGNITYTTTKTGGAGTARYAIYIRVIALG